MSPRRIVQISLLCLAFIPCLALAQSKWQKVTPNAKTQHRAYVNTQLDRLLAGQYGELEKEAAAPILPDAESIGLTLDKAFFATFRFKDWNNSPEWDRIFKALDGWEAALPDSLFSRLARSTSLIDYAWDARGQGYSDTVTESGWKLFGERLTESLKKLDEARKLGGDKHAVYWTNLLILCRGLQAPPEKVKEVVEDALKRQPENPGIYYGYCIAILPRWGGKEGEWQAWIEAQRKDARWAGKEMDPRLYAKILWQIFGYIYNTDGPFFSDKSLSWEKAKLGLDQLCEGFPKSAYWKTARAYLAWSAQDAQALKAALTALDGTYDSWAMGPENFQRMLQSAGIR